MSRLERFLVRYRWLYVAPLVQMLVARRSSQDRHGCGAPSAGPGGVGRAGRVSEARQQRRDVQWRPPAGEPI